MNSENYSLMQAFEWAWKSVGERGSSLPAWQEFVPRTESDDLLCYILEMDIEQRARRGLPGIIQQRYWDHPSLSGRMNDEQKIRLIKSEVLQRRKNNPNPPHAEIGQPSELTYSFAFPTLAEHPLWHLIPWSEPQAGLGAPNADRANAPVASAALEFSPDQLSKPPSPIDKRVRENWPDPSLPSNLGRYRVVSLLGKGGFGQVYRAVDEQLQREVAIKLTLGSQLDQACRAKFLSEARIVAALDHPSIVPVYDVGQTDEGDFFVVSKLIDGSDLATRLKLDRPDRLLALRIVEVIADALHHAHAKGLIHRDIKPANILLDRNNRPFLTDFGIALQESERDNSGRLAGTPAYMSPEQARGEGHLIDNRSDIYSLGVVLYELLTGRRPFRSDNPIDLISLISSKEVCSPRLYDDTISPELERIVLKALARRASDRFTVARDLTEEIRWLLENHAPTPGRRPVAGESSTPSTPRTPLTPSSPSLGPGVSDSQRTGPTRVVPKGLRSFDASDANFFLELLPGPFDRDGLPESLRFWKMRIEQTDDEAFRVGLIYGPSGCGKSSLVKAGLLPRLSPKILPVYVEATPEDTEFRLLRGVRKAIPGAEGGSLKEVLSIIRRRKAVSCGGKLLLVLDQFEQWLFAEKDYGRASLTEALRQCDGAAVQAIVMVRDDFWLSVSRFLKELEVNIEHDNSALVDLFDLDHAAKVLGLFGKAYGKLPDSRKDWNRDQNEFVCKAIQDLSHDEKVISVRISLFADMMKQKAWTTAALQAVGGIEGVGVTFLEEMFGSRHAPIQHRQHEEAVRGLLAALLPTTGTDIKGSMQNTAMLQQAASYEHKPSEFEELLKILDKNLRLITPVDEGSLKSEERSGQPDNTSNLALPSSHFYQLSHDYMVPSLREWLTRKQRETKKGRAELKLAERAAVWKLNQENKQLPTLVEWFQIRRWTDKKRWTASEQSLMRTATRVHSRNWGSSILSVLILGGIIGYLFQQQRESSRQEQMKVAIESLKETLGPGVVGNIKNLVDLGRPEQTRLELSQLFIDAKESREKLSLAFGLAHFGQVEADYLISQIDAIEDQDTANLINALGHDAKRSIEKMRQAASLIITKTIPRRKARLALAALALNDTTLPIDACEFEGRPDPVVRTWFIDEFRRWEIDLKKVAATVNDSTSPALRSAVFLGLGQIPLRQISSENKNRIAQLATQWYSLPDSSTHSAVVWLMREWDIPEPILPDAKQMVDGRNWFVNSQGVTFMRITPLQGNEKVPEQMYWLASREVTRGEYEAFLDDISYESEKPKDAKEATPDKANSPTPDHPAQRVSWYDAVMYCNWLSRREGRTPVYRYADNRNINDYKNGEVELNKWEEVDGANGYRLPKELEWEYACRAGSKTDWSIGSDKSLLAAYCQMYPSELTSPSGKKLPNVWGMHDMHGNVNEWCWDASDSQVSLREFRGGCWLNAAALCGSSYQHRAATTDRGGTIGLRLALSPSGISKTK